MSKRVHNSKVADQITFKLRELEGKDLNVGWVAGKTYDKSNFTTAEVAVIAEFGSPAKNIPPRPIIRPTMIREKVKWSKIAEREARLIFKGKQTAEGALERIGLVAAGDMRDQIKRIHDPALKDSTVRARAIRSIGDKMNKTKAGRKRQIAGEMNRGLIRKPLVDTKELIGSLTHEVVDS